MSVRLQHFEAKVRYACRKGDYLRLSKAFDWWIPAKESTAEAVATEDGAPLSDVRCIKVSALVGERFWAWVSNWTSGEREWREYTRQTLLDELVGRALSTYYRPTQQEHKIGRVFAAPHDKWLVDPGFKTIDMIKRIAHAGWLFDSEFEAIKYAWSCWWFEHGASVRLARSTDPRHVPASLCAVGANLRESPHAVHRP